LTSPVSRHIEDTMPRPARRPAVPRGALVLSTPTDPCCQFSGGPLTRSFTSHGRQTSITRSAAPLALSFERVLQSTPNQFLRQPPPLHRFRDFASGVRAANSFNLPRLTHCVKGRFHPFLYPTPTRRRLGDSHKGYHPPRCPSTPAELLSRDRRSPHL
jgi:hypothetical protein